DPPDWVLVHDGARPFCSEALLGRVLAALAEHAAVIPVLPVTDTVRRCVDGQSEVIDRAHLFRTQTPQ
ncbi:MAG: bifunctional 2-C-methyl-D-erythritol 4-phosphate cytidylyltransferase/2-C-methyl-D-erythritol 2,4-cyclodiphosphate synthase, partial [Gammaproteobacteria bacterium]|nr:bifunctional 2-C-methyl-D-erythritol 4-phosphate cytidylyltransferase/2-C-methyl-D-erythritol 2,4-cyclodiphosphate synthase [Gammaproteobacteria bacterium]NIT62829.1 bifunctional 2-C-methyl-D-erythritol 4-phosphate cytidylyltransferase/2-C-methyl-D-erythritol 2,4-cyclodiphosphate synthase [Gammaproteobacteria bacterium]NIY31409.1 bifunctional 2-C-methyl-D-erythritol 4-phosphate cytidylyltransferase/2-C-methyl-D-erythritol 2,4-cyclodiphosphate synthase [Gammaproteobacteria bacterium]